MNKQIRKILKSAKGFARYILPSSMFDKLEDVANYLAFSDYREYNRTYFMQRKRYGNLNPDKTFYVCRYDLPEAGVLSVYLYWLNELQEVDKMNYIPVFDLKNADFSSVQDEEDAFCKWSHYFKSTISCPDIEEVYQSKNVILGWKNGSNPDAINWMTKLLNADEIKKFNRLAVKYMDFSPEIKARAKRILDRVPAREKVLGMALRASFQRGELLGNELYRGHPKQKSLEETIELARDMMTQWQCGYIFISVDDREWLETFKGSFGEKCLWVDRERWHFFNHGQPVKEMEDVLVEFTDVTVQKKNSDYLTEVYILSQCDDLFGSLSSGMTVAQIFNNCRYEHTNICYNGSIEV